MARRNREAEPVNTEDITDIGEDATRQSNGEEGTASTDSGPSEATEANSGGTEGMEGQSEGQAQDEYRGIDPNIAAGPEQTKRRRGRQPGSKNKPKGSTGKVGITPEQLANQLSFIHGGLAMMTGLPFMALQPQESLQLSQSIIACAEVYGVDIFSGKTAVLIQLGATAAMIYVPRFLMLRQVREQRIRQAQQEMPPDAHMTAPADASNGAQPTGVFDYSAVTQ